ncbi:DUF4328 domain-containing protein [Novosphingobium sp. AP12]|uniref:DUF4328 domain-containing protein n=1 Tax=Novosphingobium sp. AP12 TaxID=1144305 RepID=UPI0002721F1A|nr:DUF4328 domain-containing protein [Novosphingobium sp. AP12]EJL24767.1 hypothetical protein PMI02_03442 [Novosphingobium sp. AP12]
MDYLSRRDSSRLLTIARVTQVFIWIYVAVWAVEALANAWSLSMMLSNGFGRPTFIVLAVRGLAMMLGSLVFLPTAVLFLIWFHKAIANLHEAGLAGLRARPGWTVGSFFVPVANLFVPFRAMRELWNRSHGEDEWQAEGAVGDVGIWWTCYLAGTLLVAFVTGTRLFNLLTNAVVMTPRGVHEMLSLCGTGMWCVSGVFLARIVGKVSQAQQSLSDDRLTFM